MSSRNQGKKKKTFQRLDKLEVTQMEQLSLKTKKDTIIRLENIIKTNLKRLNLKNKDSRKDQYGVKIKQKFFKYKIDYIPSK